MQGKTSTAHRTRSGTSEGASTAHRGRLRLLTAPNVPNARCKARCQTLTASALRVLRDSTVRSQAIQPSLVIFVFFPQKLLVKTADEHQVECEVCPAGKYSGSTDLLCQRCDDPVRTVPNGLRTACECAQQHYNIANGRWRCFESDYLQTSSQSNPAVDCDACPPCADCPGADVPPQLRPGFRAV